MAKRKPKFLTDLYIRKKIKKPGRYSDGPASNGLSALAKLAHGKLVIYFEQRIRIGEEVTKIRLGKYGLMTLKQARKQAEANVRAVAENRDPRKPQRNITFKTVAMEYIELYAAGGTWRAGGRSRRTWINSVIKDALSVIGHLHPREITSAHIMQILQPIWITKHKTARDLAGRISKIMKYAIAWGHCDSDPAEVALGGLPPVYTETKNRKYIHHESLGEALRIVAASDADPIAVNALIFAALTGVRSGELRKATWDQIDMENLNWLIPKANMKNYQDHEVPLSDIAIAVLKDTLARTGPNSKWVFPAPRGGMMHSDNLKKLFRDNGIDADIHGLRSSLRTHMEDIGIPDNIAEAVLAHKKRNPYLRTTHYNKRLPIMNNWAKYLNIWPLPSRKQEKHPPNQTPDYTDTQNDSTTQHNPTNGL